MADISSITLPSGTTYEIKDSTARGTISNLATVATSGDYDDLSNIPKLITEISVSGGGETINVTKQYNDGSFKISETSISGYVNGGSYSNGTLTLQRKNTVPDITVFTADSSPTSGSEQLVTSGGVYTALASKASVITYTATIAAADWTSSDPYTNAVTVTGLLTTDTPIMDLVASSTYATAQTEVADYGCIYKATCTTDGTLTVYASAAPSVDLDIQLVCMR